MNIKPITTQPVLHHLCSILLHNPAEGPHPALFPFTNNLSSVSALSSDIHTLLYLHISHPKIRIETPTDLLYSHRRSPEKNAKKEKVKVCFILCTAHGGFIFTILQELQSPRRISSSFSVYAAESTFQYRGKVCPFASEDWIIKAIYAKSQKLWIKMNSGKTRSGKTMAGEGNEYNKKRNTAEISASDKGALIS